jgi:hypothetical protein
MKQAMESKDQSDEQCTNFQRILSELQDMGLRLDDAQQQLRVEHEARLAAETKVGLVVKLSAVHALKTMCLRLFSAGPNHDQRGAGARVA